MADIEFDEKSSGVVTAAFEDEDGDAVIPTSILWTLTTVDGVTVINSRDQVVISTMAASVDILLQGDDLAFTETEQDVKEVDRRLTIEAVYNSSLGTDIPLKDDKIITIRNLQYIST